MSNSYNINVPDQGEPDIEGVKKIIMGWFRDRNLKAGDTLDFVHKSIIYEEVLNPKQRKVWEKAIESLLNDEFVAENPNKALVLTEKGENSIY
ncbi:MAG: hypothetical protein FWC26_03410 [Fibromonadales bacterium]|nr:hypothetical protein [Fibromonadales bacterium]